MRINDTPAMRRLYTTASRTNGHLHEGKFALMTAAGQIDLVTAATQLPNGVISEPDSHLAAQLGNPTGATLIWWSYGGIIQVKLGDTPGTINPGSNLKLTADGRVIAATGEGQAGDVIVAQAVEAVESPAANQLVPAVMVKPYTVA